ncbi:MAG: hypothetical protein J6Y94_00340, partial [Bacteriovoracaceae bacterium]|nr:hypothetical protein [Bacteriovoracaceae bacterium]
IFFIALGLYLSVLGGRAKLNLPYRIVPHTSGTPTEPGDILFIGDTQVLAWQPVAALLEEKVSAGLRTPLHITFRGLEKGGIHRVMAYLHELFTTTNFPRPQMVVFALGRHELQEYKMRTVMLQRIQRQLARENNDTWATILQLFPFLRPWVIDVGEPLVLDDLQPWPEIDEAQELLYREVATQLFTKEISLLAAMLAKAHIKLVILTAPLPLHHLPSVWPSATSLTLQKRIQQIASYLGHGQTKVAASLLEPLLTLPGNARVWYEQGRLELIKGSFAPTMEAWRKAAALNADREVPLPAYNVIAQQIAPNLSAALYDLETPAQKYLWPLLQNDAPLSVTDEFPGPDFYQAQAPALGAYLQKWLLHP